MTASPDQTHHASPGELLSDVTKGISDLMHQEVELAKVEAKQSVSRASSGAGVLAGAVVAGHFVLLFLSVGLWWAVGNSLGRSWAALIVVAIWAIVAAVLASVGKKKLQAIKGMPQTADTVKKIPDALKGNEEINR